MHKLTVQISKKSGYSFDLVNDKNGKVIHSWKNQKMLEKWIEGYVPGNGRNFVNHVMRTGSAKIKVAPNKFVIPFREHTVTFSKDEMEKLHSNGQIIKVDSDGKEHTYVYSESVNEAKYLVYVDKDGKGRSGRKIVKSDLSQMAAKRLYNKLVKTQGDNFEEIGYDDHKSWNQNNIKKVNEQEMSIKDAFKDLVKDHGSKKALDILTSGLTGGIGFEDPKKKKIFQQKLLKKMMRESINENGRVIMKSISNAKKGAIATGGGYAPFVKMGKNYWKQKKTNTKTHDDGLFDKIGTFKDFKINEVQVLRKIK